MKFFRPFFRTSAAQHSLINQRNGVTVAATVITAFDSASRRRGLLGLTAMPAGQAMIIAPSNAIHTWSMQFAIDLAFITKAGRIVKIRSNVPPRRIAASFGAFAVIELASGTLEACGTTTGDTVALVAHA